MLTSSSCNTRLSPHQEPSPLASARWEGTDLQPGRSEAKTREIIKAEKSAEWKPDAMKRIETLKQEKKISYHVLEKAGHWVHSDNPTGLINILHDELVAAENNSTI